MSLPLDELPDSLVFQALGELSDFDLVTARPPAPTCLVPVKLDHFVWRHRVSRSDSLASIAIQFGTSIPLIKRVNNIVSDHSLATRDSLYVPVGGLDSIDCKLVAYLHCHHAKRRFIVVLRDGEQPPPVAAMPASVQDRALKQLTNMFQRGFRVDENTARFYLAQAGGNVRAAMAAFEDDARWERVMRPVRRR
ncbi:hypothetical protein N2152v2_007584 [Parachlorella kessleri]